LANACSKCRGTGKLPSHLNPNGIKRTAGIGMDVCPDCAGTGKERNSSGPGKRKSGADEPPGASILVWLFGLLGALVVGVSSESAFDIWWPIGAFLGFGGGALGASVLVTFKAGRIVLWLVVIAFVGSVIYAVKSGSS